jgi:hypothetical protein
MPHRRLRFYRGRPSRRNQSRYASRNTQRQDRSREHIGICACYLGLRPKRGQSGDSDPQLGVTKAGNGYSCHWRHRFSYWTSTGTEPTPLTHSAYRNTVEKQHVRRNRSEEQEQYLTKEKKGSALD